MRAFVEHQATRFGSRRQLAKAIGIGVRKLRYGEQVGTFNVGVCLSIADATGAPVTDVLRLAGKEKEAAILARVYGDAAPSLSLQQLDLVRLWSTLEVPLQEAVLQILRSLQNGDREESASSAELSPILERKLAVSMLGFVDSVTGDRSPKLSALYEKLFSPGDRRSGRVADGQPGGRRHRNKR